MSGRKSRAALEQCCLPLGAVAEPMPESSLAARGRFVRGCAAGSGALHNRSIFLQSREMSVPVSRPSFESMILPKVGALRGVRYRWSRS